MVGSFLQSIYRRQLHVELSRLQWYVILLSLVLCIGRWIAYGLGLIVPMPPIAFMLCAVGWIVLLVFWRRRKGGMLLSVSIILLLIVQYIELMYWQRPRASLVAVIYLLSTAPLLLHLMRPVLDWLKRFGLACAWIALGVWAAHSLGREEGLWLAILQIPVLLLIAYVQSHAEKRDREFLQRVASLTDENLALRQRIQHQQETFALQQRKIEAQKELIEQQHERAERKNRRIHFYNSVLWTIARHRAVQEGQWRTAMEYILLVAAETLSVTRASLLRYHQQRRTFYTLLTYEEQQGIRNQRDEIQLVKDTFLLNQLHSRQYIAVENWKHVETLSQETHWQHYWTSNQIYSFIWVPLLPDREFQGILAFENQLTERSWSPEDLFFARSVSEVFDMVRHAVERRIFQEEIKIQKEEIEKQNRLLRQQKQEILNINQHLEQLISERTQQLEIQNQQLAEYAFVNAHLLRGPVCNILGIVQILEMPENQTPEQMKIWIPLLRQSTRRLDEIIQKIAFFLEDRGYFDRYDLSADKRTSSNQ